MYVLFCIISVDFAHHLTIACISLSPVLFFGENLDDFYLLLMNLVWVCLP